MAIRKFWLINSLNKRYDFTLKEKKQFLYNPQGLGFTKTLNTITLGDSVIKTSEQVEMPAITGDVLFYDTVEKAYQDYMDFMNFISFTPLKLYYQPPNTLSSYYIDCEITSVEKGEYNTNGCLQCPISIYGTTLWLDSKETTIIITNALTDVGKHYELIRDYHYAGSTLSNISITSNGHRPTGFVFEIFGDVTNPILNATKDDITYGKIKLNGSFDYVKIDSNDKTENIYLEKDGNVIANAYNYQDLSIADGIANITFFNLEVGESILSFLCDKVDNFDGYLKFTWNDKRISI